MKISDNRTNILKIWEYAQIYRASLTKTEKKSCINFWTYIMWVYVEFLDSSAAVSNAVHGRDIKLCGDSVLPAACKPQRLDAEC